MSAKSILRKTLVVIARHARTASALQRLLELEPPLPIRWRSWPGALPAYPPIRFRRSLNRPQYGRKKSF
jgi:hypothetical protein